MWYSQPIMDGTRIPFGNFLLSMGTLVAGGSASKLFRSFYVALVNLYLDYASEVWSGHSVQQMVMIDGVQKQATKYILGISGGEMSYEEQLRKLNIIPLSYRH